MEKITEVVMGTLYEVAMELTKGESIKSMEALEQSILLLEVAMDNAASEGKPVEELEQMHQQLINLQTQVFRYATE